MNNGLTLTQQAAKDTVLGLNILDVATQIGAAVKKVSASRGGIYRGACPKCGGSDRFTIKLEPPIWSCNQCSERWGDTIGMIRFFKGLTFGEVLETWGGYIPANDNDYGAAIVARKNARLSPKPTATVAPIIPADVSVSLAPGATWQAAAGIFVNRCQIALWSDKGAGAREYLNGRGLTDETIKRAGIGYNPMTFYVERGKWGIVKGDNEGDKMKLSQGLIFPYFSDGQLWSIRVRLDEPIIADNGKKDYYRWVYGTSGAKALYNADTITEGGIVVLSEGEIDSLSIWQATGYTVGSVATAGIYGARADNHLMTLAAADCVIVAFDNDENGQGDKGAAFWLNLLEDTAYRLLPVDGCKDSNEMLQKYGDEFVFDWLNDGLLAAAASGIDLMTGDKIRAFLA